MVVKITEECDEAESVDKNNQVQGVGVVTVGEQVVNGVNGYHQKLKLWIERENRREITTKVKWDSYQYTPSIYLSI